MGFGNGSNAAEFLNFLRSQSENPCRSIPEYPLGEVWETVVLIVNEKIVLCGGVNYGSMLDWCSDCFILSVDE